MPLELNPQELPPEDRVQFKGSVIWVDGTIVGTITKILDRFWRIDTIRDLKLVVGTGQSEDEAKRFWWRNWKSYDPTPFTAVD